MEKLCESSILFLLISSLFNHSNSAVTDTINTTHGIRDGDTLVSSNGTFEVGFFSPGNSSNWYVGMWYRNLPVRTVVWVANREVPIMNTTNVVFTVIEPGILVLLSDTNGTIWSSNASRSVRNPVAQLLETGNLVVREANDNLPENFLWQSFDYPTDTFLPGIKLGWNLVAGLETYLVSWRSNDDPSPGGYSFHLDPTGYPQVVLKRGDDVQNRIGPWNGIRFSGSTNTKEDSSGRVTFIMNENEVYYQEDSFDTSVASRFSLNQSGILQYLTWVAGRGWTVYWNFPPDICSTYRSCGPNGICNYENSPLCGCLDRFVPRNPEGWFRTDWSDGCVRRRNLSCEGDVFLRYSGIKLPDARFSWHNINMTLQECRAECLRNCSCTGYMQLDIRRRSGCLIWFEDLIDIRSLSSNGEEIYIRMNASEADSGGRNQLILTATLTSVIVAALMGLSLFSYIKRRKNDSKMKNHQKSRETGLYGESHRRDSELPQFDLSVILKATDNFSFDKKLGQGGFGPVYKGMLNGEQEIAVKRLSKDSMQGVSEFKNEVIFIAKLQHRNLVRLLGCCIEGEESMLIYEYMPNNSLDLLLFDQTKSKQLDWEKRFHIIKGVARGLLYLHQDSRLRIIHRDLKASNVLLDCDMNPKISDFGMARCFSGNETEAKTRRVVGTYGYMSPEYAVEGLFSVKSDVFSFGVLVLEILSGKRNWGFSHTDHNFNLLGHAWTLYKDGRSSELFDPCLGESFNLSEVVRSIHVGLLCVQQKPEDRPIMSSVVRMLENEDIFPQAKYPGFFTGRDVIGPHSSSSISGGNSKNDLTISIVEPR